LGKALERARIALAYARTVNDDRAWHKFRIAVKEVRYVAEASRFDPASAEFVATVVDTCKKVQALLGSWHDTVVQLNILAELEASPVHSRLREVISERKQEFLSRTRDDLAKLPLFLPES